MRFLLDAHPTIFCPPETNLAAIVGTFISSFKLAHGDEADPDEPTLAVLRNVVDAVVRPSDAHPYQRWCDKSLITWQDPEMLLKVWPNASFLCLYRHIMDFIASAVETAPWGFRGYGFAPYVSRSPQSFPRGLAYYWIERTSKMLEFERDHKDICCGIRYEDLITDPETISTGIWDFLEVQRITGIEELMFSNKGRHGASDYKIWRTEKILDHSIGRGTSVPVHAIPESDREGINQLLQELEYQEISEHWGCFGMLESVKNVPESVEATSAGVAEPLPSSESGQISVAPQDSAIDGSSMGPGSANEELLAHGGDNLLENSVPYRRDELVERLVEAGAFEGLTADQETELLIVDGMHILKRFLVSPTDSCRSSHCGTNIQVGEKAEDTSLVFIVTRSALLGLVMGSVDLSVSIHRGDIRCYNANGPADLEDPADPEIRSFCKELSLIGDRVNVLFSSREHAGGRPASSDNSASRDVNQLEAPVR